MAPHRLLLTAGFVACAAACGAPQDSTTQTRPAEAGRSAGGEGTRPAVHTTTRVTVRPGRRAQGRSPNGSAHSHTGHGVVVVQDPTPQRVVVVEAPPGYAPGSRLQAPLPAATVEHAPYAGPDDAAVRCSGEERLEITDQRLDRDQGPAVVAAGRCQLAIDESIIEGEPALVVRDEARIVILDSKIRGDLVSTGRGHVTMRRSDHRGRVIRQGVAHTRSYRSAVRPPGG